MLTYLTWFSSRNSRSLLTGMIPPATLFSLSIGRAKGETKIGPGKIFRYPGRRCQSYGAGSGLRPDGSRDPGTSSLACVLQNPRHGKREQCQKDKDYESNGVAALAQIADREAKHRRNDKPAQSSQAADPPRSSAHGVRHRLWNHLEHRGVTQAHAKSQQHDPGNG